MLSNYLGENPELKNPEESANKIAIEATKEYINELINEGEEEVEKQAEEFYKEEYDHQIDRIKTAAKINEMETLENWKKDNYSNTSPHIKDLLKAHNKIINTYTNLYSRNPNVSKPAVKAEAYKLYITALKNYDPSKGTQPSTHIHTYMKKLRRYVDSHSNIAKIPEPRILLIKDVNNAREHLYNTFNKQPSLEEIHEEVNKRRKEEEKPIVKLIDLKRLETEVSKKDLAESGLLEDIESYRVPTTVRAIQMLHHSNKLDESHKKILQHMFPMNEEGGIDFNLGKKPASIARSLGISAAKMTRQISSIRKAINETTQALG
jgi:DNA-directed RNA polymerase specialized sigma subunit